MKEAREKGHTVVIVHNHPTESPPSPQDVLATVLGSDLIREQIIVTDDSIYTLTPGTDTPTDNARDEFVRMMRKWELDLRVGRVGIEQWERALSSLFAEGIIGYEYRQRTTS